MVIRFQWTAPKIRLGLAIGAQVCLRRSTHTAGAFSAARAVDVSAGRIVSHSAVRGSQASAIGMTFAAFVAMIMLTWAAGGPTPFSG